MTPISTANNRPGLSRSRSPASPNSAIAITPDGKTVYVANTGTDTVTPISTATNKPGKTDHGRCGALCDRDHAGWEDRLRRCPGRQP